MADENVKPTDGNTKQWDKLQKMRKASGTNLTNDDGTAAASPGSEQRASAEEIKAEQERLQSGEPVGGDEREDAGDDDGDDGDDDGETPEPEKVVVKEHERKKPEQKTATPKPRDGFEFVEIDGKQVEVDASLAAAYRDAETNRASAATQQQHQQLVDDIVTKVTAQLPKQPTAADAAAAAAVKPVEEELKHPYPDSNLAISDPTEFNKQLQAHIDEKTTRAAQKAIADKEARDAAAHQTQQQASSAQQIAWAKEQLGIQFYRQFKVLDDPAVRPLVDVLLNKKFDEVLASGAVAKPLPPKEAEAMKLRAFNDVAAEATRSIVKLRGTASSPTPAEAPPNLNTSSPTTGQKKKVTPPKETSKKAFPTGSVSAMLRAHQDKKAGRTSA